MHFQGHAGESFISFPTNASHICDIVRLYNCILCAILETLDLLNYFFYLHTLKFTLNCKTLWILTSKLDRVFTITISYE